MEYKENLHEIVKNIGDYIQNNNVEFPYNIENVLDNLEKIDSKYAILSKN